MKDLTIFKAWSFSFAKISVFILLSLIIGHTACAQVLENRVGKGQNRIIPVMKISNLNKDEANPMKIDELKIDIHVLGQIAVTTMEFSYYNTNNRVMEGEFSFPLAEGQTISRFALDINGQMREGVVVEKEQGRKTFEAVARRNVDPGLLEMTEGTNFRARVFPLPAKGFRRIIIAYEQELTDKGSGYLYQLPLKINDEIRSFAIHAEVFKHEVKCDIGENELANFEFKQWNDAYLADFKAQNYTPEKQLAFMLPHTSEKAAGYTEAFSNSNDSSWFYLNLRPQPFNREKALPHKITVFWDNSHSCTNREIEKELSVLDGYIHKIGNLQIVLVPFNIRTEKPVTFTVTAGNWNELRQVLSNMVYDGGTSFGTIDFTNYPCDEILLFSDGLSNFGKSAPFFSNVPVMVFNSNTTANHSFLNYISQRSGGQYINLAKVKTDEAVAMLTKSDYHFISATIIRGNVSEVYPSVPTQFQNSFGLAGIIKGNTATLALHFGFGSTVVYTDTITVSAEKPTQTGILRRTWAQKKLNDLNANAEANKEAITRLGKEFGIVTPNTSLLVLENLNDYLQYHIVPPKEMQADYYNSINREQQAKADKITTHIDYVAGLFDARVKWWNTVYTKPAYIKKAGGRVYYVPAVVSSDDAVTTESIQTINQEGVTDDANAVPPDVEQLSEVMVVGYGTAVNNHATTGMDKKEKSKTLNQTTASIQLNAWDPQTPYLKVLQYAAKGDEYTTYLKLKKEFGTTPLFYVDASDFFANAGQKDLALKIVSNLAEMKLEEPQLLRILGCKLQSLNHHNEAVDVFEKIVKLKGEEPQSYRDLGLAYETNGQYQLAINTLYEVVKRDWDGRFPEIELIALEELNHLLANPKLKLDYSFIDKRLIKNLPIDIRVVITWDTDNCDMDLWVTDPSGEKCFYGHKTTEAGGLISCDFTQGYGPEEFLLKKAINGEYLVQANYYGTRSQTLLAPVTLHLTFFTNYGKPDQKKQETTIRLENQKDVIDIGKFVFKPSVK
jgi:hypothetical protein